MTNARMVEIYGKAQRDAQANLYRAKCTVAYHMLEDWYNQMQAAVLTAYHSFDNYSLVQCLLLGMLIGALMQTWPTFMMGLCAGIMTPDNVGLLTSIVSGLIWFTIFAAVTAISYELFVCTIGVFVIGKGLQDLNGDYHKIERGELTIRKII